MTKLRKGDYVVFKAVVTDVADYDKGQQICAKLLPMGTDLGWCVPKEYDFSPVNFVLRVGDLVKWSQRSVDAKAEYEILLLTDTQATVRKVGNREIELANLKHLTRI